MFKSSSFSLVFFIAALFCSGVSAQRQYHPSIIASVESAKCLTVRNSKFANGTPVEMQTCNNGTSQGWVEIYNPRDGNVIQVSIADPDRNMKYCLDAKTVHTSSKVVITDCTDGKASQQWLFVLTDPKPQKGRLILADNHGLCLDVPDHSTRPGVQVETYACNGGQNQAWTVSTP